VSEEVWSQFDFTNPEKHMSNQYLRRIVEASLPAGFSADFWDRVIYRIRLNQNTTQWSDTVRVYYQHYNFVPTREYLSLLLANLNKDVAIVSHDNTPRAAAFNNGIFPAVNSPSLHTETVEERILHFWAFPVSSAASSIELMCSAFAELQLANSTELILVARRQFNSDETNMIAQLSERAAAANWKYDSHSVLPNLTTTHYEFMARFVPEPPIFIQENRSALSRFNLVL
jgi:hypothetical protein